MAALPWADFFKLALADGGLNQNRTAAAVAGGSGSNRISGVTITDGGSGCTSPPQDVQVATLWTNDGTRLGLGEKEPVDWLQLPVTRGPCSRFKKMDQNSDGSLTREEFISLSRK